MKKDLRHSQRKHSKWSASGSDRWLNCPGSVGLEESAPPQKENAAATEGTLAHEYLEKILTSPKGSKIKIPASMSEHLAKSANAIWGIQIRNGGELFVEKRTHLEFEPEAFGTTDAAVVNEWGHLDIIDFKYGKGHVVDPKDNTQLVMYALGWAAKYDWFFTRVNMHIIQPRAGSRWHKTWSVPIEELEEKWTYLFKKGIERTKKPNPKLYEGNWCFWCKAKSICPLKSEKTIKKVVSAFDNQPIKEFENGEESKEKIKSGLPKRSQEKGQKSSEESKVKSFSEEDFF